MKIMVAHNFYQQPGGEDQVFASETRLLSAHGHEPLRYQVHNDEVNGMSRLALAAATVWNRRTYDQLLERVRSERVDVVHFHNTLPLISPAAYAAARKGGAAVVQTLHNYRLVCPNATLYRDGKVCEDCVGKRFAWPGVLHKCYRGSRATTAAAAGMVWIHHGLGTWRKNIDVYIALTESGRQRFIAGGLPAERIMVKPNFVDPDPGVGSGDGGYAVFVGRLSPEKGLATLLDAWPKVTARLPLKIIGDGPMAGQAARAAAACPSIQCLGRAQRSEVYDLIGRAAMLILPSHVYEGFPNVIPEAFAKGTPVVASNHGAMASAVQHGRTGLLFEPENAAQLARAVDGLANDPARLAAMRRQARLEYEAKYTGEINYRQLMEIYRRAIQSAQIRGEGSRLAGRSAASETEG